jgi:hypothetical protein
MRANDLYARTVLTRSRRTPFLAPLACVQGHCGELLAIRAEWRDPAVTFEGWRCTIAILASIQAHTLLLACAFGGDAPARLVPHTILRKHYEEEIDLDPVTDTPLIADEGGGAGGGDFASSTRANSTPTVERRRGSTAGSHGKTAKSAKTAKLSPGPSLDWLYARVAARANENAEGQSGGEKAVAEGGGDEGARGDPTVWRTPAHVQNPDWRACPVSVPARPAYAHVIADVDAEGHAVAVRLVDADPGTNEAALQCAREAHYIPAHDAQGSPVRGRTRVFRVEFPQ